MLFALLSSTRVVLTCQEPGEAALIFRFDGYHLCVEKGRAVVTGAVWQTDSKERCLCTLALDTVKSLMRLNTPDQAPPDFKPSVPAGWPKAPTPVKPEHDTAPAAHEPFAVQAAR